MKIWKLYLIVFVSWLAGILCAVTSSPSLWRTNQPTERPYEAATQRQGDYIAPDARYYVENAPQATWDAFLLALAKVESNVNPLSIGDKGRAVGQYQIWKIYVDDVNRILRKETFGYEDRTDPVKSGRMVRVYLSHYCTEERLGRPPTFEDAARIHNGGPMGHKKQATIKYADKVMERMSYENFNR